MTNPQDEITKVLRECEQTLRTLAAQNRLSAGALKAFVHLSATVKAEVERRRNPDRRETPRSEGDRREGTRATAERQGEARAEAAKTPV